MLKFRRIAGFILLASTIFYGGCDLDLFGDCEDCPSDARWQWVRGGMIAPQDIYACVTTRDSTVVIIRDCCCED